MYPVIEINLNNIIENVKITKKICEKNNIKFSLVTKVLANNKKVVSKLVNNGVDCICESRIKNLISYKDIEAEKWLIRIPMMSEVKDVIKYSDASLNSEMKVIKALNDEAFKQNKKHKVIIMYELGDLREGLLKDDLMKYIEETIKLSNIILYGIGVNLSCYGEILPDDRNMKELSDLVTEIENKFNIKLEIVSGGNSSSYDMMKNGMLPKNINNLRLGESVFLGNLPCFNKELPELNHNNFVLKAEIIELKEKPTVPWGESGLTNSYGETINFIDRGIRKRAIIALGKQDVNIDGIFPVDEKIIINGGSSDHIILDVTDSNHNYKVGDIIEFNLNYSGVLSLMTSNYINRKVI